LAEDFVPKEVIDRPKRGFAIPRAEWIRGPLRETIADLLFGKTTQNRGWIDTNRSQLIFQQHILGKDRDRIIWPLISLELWARNWID
jgi:asparagine synthase (glutamine-hydrolysing)